MKADYKNRVPKGMLYALIAGTLLSFIGLLLFGVLGVGAKRGLCIALTVIFAVALLVCGKSTQWCVRAYNAFSYDGKRQLSKQIIDGMAAYITLPEGGEGLDVGCGSGALTIACGKRNPQGRMLGIDRRGREYASFSMPLCQNNAKAEGVANVNFRRGDATKLDFPDESFEAVTSNYTYRVCYLRGKSDKEVDALKAKLAAEGIEYVSRYSFWAIFRSEYDFELYKGKEELTICERIRRPMPAGAAISWVLCAVFLFLAVKISAWFLCATVLLVVYAFVCTCLAVSYMRLIRSLRSVTRI